MSAAKKLLLEASETEEKFLSIFKRHRTPDDDFSLEEALPTLNKRELDLLWENLQNKFTATVLSFGQQEERLDTDCHLIRGIVAFAVETISQRDVYVPESLIQVALMLHGILLALPDDIDAVKNSISRLLELWWKERLPCHQQLAPNMLTYLLLRAERPNAVKADIKRVYQIREALAQINLLAESSAVLRKSIQSAFRSLLYLKTDDGRKFLSCALNQTPEFTGILHDTVKRYLPWSPKSVMPFYGEVYLRAWQYATGPNLEKLELSCIQDFMYYSILAKPDVASLTRNVISYIHEQKARPGVDHMLVTLYEPILWRYLKVANGKVRLQAVLQLLDAFPLTSPEWHVQERDNLLQRQFDTLREMLYDPLPAVRAAVISGMCSICEKYWELLPAEVIKDLFGSIVNDLAYDGSSAEVRVAVFRGISKLINNPLTHVLLKTMLPRLASCLHDSSEKVRTVFVEMLLKLKGIKALKFWDIVPYHHLLARLELDTPPVAKRLVKLLLDSHLSPDKTVQVHLMRCVSLIEENRAVARRFYQYVGPYTTLGTVGRLMAAIFMMLESSLSRLDHADSSQCIPVPNVEPDFLESFGEEEKCRSGERTLPFKDCEQEVIENENLVLGLVEVVTILWTGLHQELNKPVSDELRQKLEKQASCVLPKMFKHFKDPQIITALIKLSGFIPPTLLPTVSQSLFTKLQHITVDTPEEEYAAVVEVLCMWGMAEKILVMISDWLMSGLQVDVSRSKSCRSLDIADVDDENSEPLLGLRLINFLIKHKQCRETLLADPYKHAVRELTTKLSVVKSCLEKHLQSLSSMPEEDSSSLFADIFEIYLKLEVLLHDKRRRSHSAVTVIEQILSWADVEILALIKSKRLVRKGRRLLNQTNMTLCSEAPLGDSNGTAASDLTSLGMTTLGATINETLSDTLAGQKRTAGARQMGSLKMFAIDLIQRLLKVTSDMFLVGVGNKELASHLADFSLLLMKIDDELTIHFLPIVCHLMYQISCCLMMNSDLTSDEEVSSEDDVVSRMLNNVLNVILTMATNGKQKVERIFPSVASVISEVLSVYCYHHSLNKSLQKDVMMTITTALINDMTSAIEQDFDFEPREKMEELPKLTTFLLGLVWKQPAVIGFFLSELQCQLDSDAVTNMSSLAGSCHLLYTITKAKRSLPELKDCVLAVQGQLEKERLIPEELLEDSPIRLLYRTCKTLLDKCKLEIGMI